jgi:predicted MFS family arabinose efflux permease
LGMLPLSLLLARDAPQGTEEADEETLANSDDSTPPDSPAVDFTFGQAIRTPAFWVLALGSGAFNLVWSALTLFNQSILEEHGFDVDAANSVLAILVGTGLVSNMVGGALVRRERMGWLLGLGLAILSLALFCFPRVATQPALMGYAAAIGISGGFVTVIFFAAWGGIFGRVQVGRIQGLAQLITVVASAIGPDLMAEGRALTASYTSMFYALATLTGGLALAAIFVRIPSLDLAGRLERTPALASVPTAEEA